MRPQSGTLARTDDYAEDVDFPSKALRDDGQGDAPDAALFMERDIEGLLAPRGLRIDISSRHRLATRLRHVRMQRSRDMV